MGCTLTTEEVAYIDRTIADLEQDNAKLREQGERLLDKTLELGTDNAKLRELAREMYRMFVRGHDWGPWCVGETAWVEDRMKSLGVEV